MKPVRTMSTFGYSIQEIARQLANCLEAFDKQACQKFEDPQRVLENGKAIKGFIPAVDKARMAARRRLRWKEAVCPTNGSLSLQCTINDIIEMPDGDPSKFAEIALKLVRRKGVNILARCAVLDATTGKENKYREVWRRNCLGQLSADTSEAALRREVPDFERAYAEALMEHVRAKAKIIGRDLASLSLLGGYVGKPREAIEGERRRLIAFFPKADVWIAEQERIAIEDKTRLR